MTEIDWTKYDTKQAAYEAGKKEGRLAALDGEQRDPDSPLAFEDIQAMPEDEIGRRFHDDDFQAALRAGPGGGAA